MPGFAPHLFHFWWRQKRRRLEIKKGEEEEEEEEWMDEVGEGLHHKKNAPSTKTRSESRNPTYSFSV